MCLFLLSCQAENARGPTATATLTPATIPEGDAFSTPVLLDARASSDPEEAALTYHWRIRETDQYRIDPLDVPPPDCSDHLYAPCVVLRFAGDHPVPIELFVESDSGSDSYTITLGLTVDIAPDPTEDAPVECGTDGALLWGICWYLGDFTQNCYTVCSAHGGYHPDTPEHVGTPSQGGSVEECGEILEALGYSGTASEGYREDGLGLGCHVWRDGSLWWLDSPDFEPGDTAENGQIVCGCRE